jgi:hypothetical protein
MDDYIHVVYWSFQAKNINEQWMIHSFSIREKLCGHILFIFMFFSSPGF